MDIENKSFMFIFFYFLILMRSEILYTWKCETQKM